MKIQSWLSNRGPEYVAERGKHLLERYGVSPRKAMDRIERCLAVLDDHGCPPTLPTPGNVVHRYPEFLRHIQAAGAELAVHSYDHVDLAACPLPDALDQLSRAAAVFKRNGIDNHGFRCPYLSCPDSLLENLPEGLFRYSSNRAIVWPIAAGDATGDNSVIFQVLEHFYTPASATDCVSVPWIKADLVEIPVSLPDDLQLHDGLGLGPDGLADQWRRILLLTHARGELFVLLFHPELAERCESGFVEVLTQAKALQPHVWRARLREIATWWQEKASFTAITTRGPDDLEIVFDCSPRATILVKGLAPEGPSQPWTGSYQRWPARTIRCPARPRPLLGLTTGAPPAVVQFLREQGYLLEVGELAQDCAVYLDSTALARLDSQVKLIDFVEASPGPLVRFWRWPDGAKSTLCISGDLDALSLLDYTSRLFAR